MARFDLAPYRPVALGDLVRLGRDHDGGYIVSRRTIDAARVLVGLGISNDWSFEADFVRHNPRARVVGVDGSVSPGVFRRRALDHLGRAARGLARARRSIVLGELWGARQELRMARDMARFFGAPGRRFVRRYVEAADGPEAVSWATLARRHAGLGAGGGPCDVFLKMDIEGAEYRTLPGVLPNADRVAGAVVEFHDLERQWDRFAPLMDALQGPFAVAHLHGNNFEPLIPGTRTPQVLEVSFVNRRLVPGPVTPSTAAYPLPGLDMPCWPARPEYALAL